ncbi:MT-A70 family methyltransferase [Kaistia nematophila]|uniref:MT-A70 family methyltransferase n=1 Tax=Kaistia nematophila TaxID=2994654 RepID=A0A9X3E468_9HYPH|nr:MT-A70 family methyltransferase [Kaistia nematophila]MCX5571464.1 MT-A70 family methyltransferase [Kaistia nematophila]
MLPFHPFANLFPLIEGSAFDELAADVAERGLREPVVLLDGQILDGRNRYRASRAAGLINSEDSVDPADARHFVRFIPAVDGDPLGYVISKNMHRRQLTDDQRRMIAARLVTMSKGRPDANTANGGISRQQAAEQLSADEAGVERARTVINRAVPEIVAAVDDRKMSVRAAAEIATLPVPEQKAVLARIAAHGETAQAFRAVIKDLRDEKTAEKKARRAGREADLAVKQRALPDRRYGVIYADPEWPFEPYSRETGMDRAPDNHYPTSSVNDIVLRPVGNIAAKDSVIFLWATAAGVKAALRVMEHWGFTYKTHFIWLKDRTGTGYWNRNKHELLLVGTRGDIPAPAMGEQWPSVIEAPVGAHSAKPEIFAELIEAYYPNLPKIELNARRARPGWDVWGLEAPEAAA